MLGLRHALMSSATRPLFLVAYAAFAATAFEGMIIDSDHWRHFYVLLAIVWGLMTASASRSGDCATRSAPAADAAAIAARADHAPPRSDHRTGAAPRLSAASR